MSDDNNTPEENANPLKQNISGGKVLLIIAVVIGLFFWLIADSVPEATNTNSGNASSPNINAGQPAAPAPTPTNQYARIDSTAFSVIQQSLPFCEVFEDMTVVDRDARTAGALNHPAYIIEVNFNCHSNISGIENFTQYIGLVENKNTGNIECLSRDNEKSDIIYSTAWGQCGGLN